MKDVRRGRGRGRDPVPANGKSCLPSPPGGANLRAVGSSRNENEKQMSVMKSCVELSGLCHSSQACFLHTHYFLCHDLLISSTLETWYLIFLGAERSGW